MEKVNTRMAVAAVLLLLGVLLAGQTASAAEASSSPQLGSSKGDCEISGTCGDMKLAAAADPTRPGKPANTYTRGCSSISQCRGG
ncbi:hypothetical protein PVAP13_5NG084400 [Panicum virgatum]|uniref:Rapid alkalinization factor-like n=1 Tax=Panicum virgatum TaxID=38727 RepID=A0A8T0RPQ7_PANVG|nr:hypothetical protein PVAP13_5NG084400 [Panicum virgatum]